MATTLHSDGIIRDAEFRAGFIEGVGQNIQAITEQTRGGITFTSDYHEGYYTKESFFDAFGDTLISRRDLTSTAAATGIKATMDEKVGVKLFRTAGPVDYTLGLFRTMNMSPEAFSEMLGQRFALRLIKNQLNAALGACAAFLSGESGLVHDNTAGATTFSDLSTLLTKRGDAQNEVVAWVMHSQSLQKLRDDGLTNYKIENVAGNTIVTGQTDAMGRPFLVTDSSDLIITDGVTTGTDAYVVLGLVPGGVMVNTSEGLEIVEYFVDRQQITRRIHGEVAYTISIKGAEWDETNGGANPTDATLTTATNWDAIVASDKDKAGVYMKSDES